MTAAYTDGPLVSVIVPFYNVAKTLPDTVRSVLAQTYANWELVLLDDGSTDSSLELARRISDPRVRVLSDGLNRGLIHRLNQMVDVARGEYIARLDGDDLMHPERLQRQLDYLRAHPDCDLVCSAAISLSDDLRACGFRDTAPLDVSAANLLRTGAIIHPTVMAKTAWFRANRYRDGYDRAEDRELWLRAAPHSVLGKITEPLLFYREVGFFFLQKFLKSYATERRIIREYGPGRLGLAQTGYLYVRSLLKSVAIRAIAALGQGERLVAQRFDGNDAMASYQAIIESVRQVRIPGIDADAGGAS
ncbi:MAG: putative glycosyltransferase [Moraxellaceae bacterium]|nr:putative glycosyltransferase [Moraxellaceae bacterium]